MTAVIRCGDRVRIKDANGDWHNACAASAVEGTHATDPRTGAYRKVHDFPVVWVDVLGRDKKPHRLPWPATYVEHRDD